MVGRRCRTSFLELIDTQLGDVGVDLKFEKRGAALAEGGEEEEETTEFEDEELDEDEDDEDEDEDEEEEEEEPARRGVIVSVGKCSPSSAFARAPVVRAM